MLSNWHKVRSRFKPCNRPCRYLSVADSRKEGTMRRGHWWSLAGLLAVLALMLTVAAEAQVVRPAAKVTLQSRLVKETKLKKADVAKLVKALGLALREELKANGEVQITGLGTIRVVRVTEYKDLVNGLPRTIPARNYIEFVADSATESAV